MSLCLLSYLGGMLDHASAISCGSDAVMCPVTGRIITELSCSTPPFLRLQFHENDLSPTPRLLQVWPILPLLGHILSTMSIVQAHIDNHNYQVDDRILCYFAFPRIGTDVALQPGDFPLFNPQEPHFISSCCKSGDKIFCIFSYLKMGVVGLNDNSNPVE
jgi:hypothetical protein